jgi:serine kinase of HPr protein (carbohydrate metabolism regulator)
MLQVLCQKLCTQPISLAESSLQKLITFLISNVVLTWNSLKFHEMLEIAKSSKRELVHKDTRTTKWYETGGRSLS